MAKLSVIGIDKYFLITQQHKKCHDNKLEYIKLKGCCTSKKIITKSKKNLWKRNGFNLTKTHIPSFLSILITEDYS